MLKDLIHFQTQSDNLIRWKGPMRSHDTQMSASAGQRGITLQVFSAWGCTQERTVAVCSTRLHFVSDSAEHPVIIFEFDMATVRQSVLLCSGQQFVDRTC